MACATQNKIQKQLIKGNILASVEERIKRQFRHTLIPARRMELSEGQRTQIAIQFDVRDRLASLRDKALKRVAYGQEIFAQCSHVIGRTIDWDLGYLILSISASSAHWRGDWLLAVEPAEDAEIFGHYMAIVQELTAISLRRERVQEWSL